VVSDISESLGVQQGGDEVAEEEDSDGEPRGVLDAHSRSTPLTIIVISAKDATVRITNTRSDIAVLPVIKWLGGDHKASFDAEKGVFRGVDGFLTAIRRDPNDGAIGRDCRQV
jgi:hypothetical protein